MATMQCVSFRLGEQLLGIEILLVREINRQMDSTRVQLAPEYILGLANLRGQIVTIVDLAARIGLPCNGQADESHNIVLKSNGELAAIRSREKREDLTSTNDPVGLRVDAIGDIVEVETHQIEPVPANLGNMKERFLAGVVPLEKELLILLDVKALVGSV
jgi:purine-binding chemotaxis protein CheW